MENNKLINKFNYYLLLSVIIFIPFYRFAQGVLSFHTGLNSSTTFWLVHFYEPIMLLALLATFLLNRNLFREKRLAISIILLIFAGILLLAHRPLGFGLEGFRFDLFGVLVFILAISSGFKANQKRAISLSYVYIASFIALWAIIERFLPGYYWGNWGVLNPAENYWYGWHGVVNLTQSVSLVGGPNQLGTYLLPAFFLALFSKSPITKILAIVLLAGIALSFSRSAWLGTVIGLAVLSLRYILKKDSLKKKLGYAASFLVVLALGTLLYKAVATHYPHILTHGQSQSEHLEAYKTTILEIKDRLKEPATFLFGAGLGTAGPLALKYGRGLVSESWYLQIMLEMGLIGLLLFAVWFLQQFIYLHKKDFALFISLLGVFVASAFLHTWSDNPAVTYTLFILIGMTYEGIGKTEAKTLI